MSCRIKSTIYLLTGLPSSAARALISAVRPLRYMISNRKLTPEIDRAIRDALDGVDDMDEDMQALPIVQQGMWELAYMQGRCAPILSDGEYLRERLKAKGLTMEQAAEACEVSKAAVHSWCAGIKPIPQARRELLAERLGILI